MTTQKRKGKGVFQQQAQGGATNLLGTKSSPLAPEVTEKKGGKRTKESISLKIKVEDKSLTTTSITVPKGDLLKLKMMAVVEGVPMSELIGGLIRESWKQRKVESLLSD